jgi:hypothetical protein
MGSPDSLLVNGQQPPSPTDIKLGFFKRLRSKLRRSVSPPLQDSGLGIEQQTEARKTEEEPVQRAEDIEDPGVAVVVAAALNPFKKRKNKSNEDDLYEAVDHWTDEW